MIFKGESWLDGSCVPIPGERLSAAGGETLQLNRNRASGRRFTTGVQEGERSNSRKRISHSIRTFPRTRRKPERERERI